MAPAGSEHQNGLYYGWIMVIALGFIVFIFWGTFYSFGVFLKPLSQELEWTRAQTSGAFGLGMVAQGVAGLIGGVATDRFGPRVVMTVSSLAAGLGYLLTAQVGALWQLYLYYGFLVAIGSGASYVVPVATIPRWFTEKRGLALGIVLAGVGMGQMVIPPTLTHVITSYGWRSAYALMGAMIIAIALPASLLLRPSSGVVGMPTREALRALRFWFLFAIWFLVAIPLQIMLVHIVPYATDRGIPPVRAALLLTLMGISVTIARGGVGWISDIIGNRFTYGGCLFLQLVVMFFLLRVEDFGGFAAAAVVFGVGYGGAASVFPKVVADVFGLRAIGAIIGLLGMGWSLGGALGPPLAGFVFDLTGEYFGALLSGGLVLAVALGLAYALLKK